MIGTVLRKVAEYPTPDFRGDRREGRDYRGAPGHEGGWSRGSTTSESYRAGTGPKPPHAAPKPGHTPSHNAPGAGHTAPVPKSGQPPVRSAPSGNKPSFLSTGRGKAIAGGAAAAGVLGLAGGAYALKRHFDKKKKEK